MFDVFSNEDFIKKLATDKPKLTRKIVDKIGEWVKEIRSAIELLSVRGENPEIKALMDDAEKLDTIRNMLLEGYKNAGENFKAEQAKGQKNNAEGAAVKYSKKYNNFNSNEDIINLISKVKSGHFKDNERVELGIVSNKAAKEIEKLLGIDVSGFKVAIEARQIFHILNDHGAKGKADHSMENDDDIAKIEYVLNDFDEISFSGKTQAYSYMKDGFNRTAETVLYEKDIGSKSYYVVQAVPNSKKKTLYIVSAFIGIHGYKNGASQLINTPKGPNATAKTGSVVTPNNSIPKTIKSVKQNFSVKQTDEITKFNMQTAKENRIYRQIFNLLDDAVYTGIKIKKIPDPKFIRQQAQEMLKEVGSTYSVDEFTEDLTVIYEYMSQQAGKNLYKTEDFFPNVLAIARRVVDQCTERDSSAYDDAKEIRDVIKETPIYISPELKNEIISQFGSYLFSSVIFSTCFVKYST